MRHDTAVRLGAGGMGEVFKAWDPALERHVALKYLRYDDPELVERLFREARAQARINHPGICEVYEVGEDDGRPFIAMQFVDGQLLHDAASGLSVEQKVVIIKQVAQAVQAAHSEGLIHRDLKPSNLMVEETADGELRPYVLDFGIAREQEVSGVTLTGQVMGTPGYLSPEQARGEAGGLDRRSDVFSLGVILYELLAGTLPFQGTSDVEVLVALLEDEPIPLRRFAPQVPRDLETIVMRCLEPEPDRRYASARELSEDLDRFLAGEPVEAQHISLPQRVLRKARRHKIVTAIVLVSAAAVVTLLAVMVGGWVKYTTELEQERNAAVEAQQNAEQKKHETEEVTDFLINVFEVSDPSQARGENITAREILDRGAERVTTELDERPRIQARLMGVIGTIYSKLGMLDQAQPLLEKSVDTVTDLADADTAQIVDAHVKLADMLIRKGEYDRAAELLDPLSATAEDELGADHLQVAQALDSLGRARIRQGDYQEADRLIGRALDIALKVVGPNHLDTASIENDLAVVSQRRGDYERADELFQRALTTRQRHLEPDDHRIATTLSNYGELYRSRGRYKEALPLLERALEIREKTLGPEHPRIATTCNNLALVYKKLARNELAEALYLRALGIRESTYGPDHTRVAIVLLNLANLHKSMGRLDAAEGNYRRAAEIYSRHRPKHPTRATILNGLADLLRAKGEFAEATILLDQALNIQTQTLGTDHVATAKTLVTMGLVRIGQSRNDEALALLNRALGIQEKNLGPEHAAVGNTLFEVAAIQLSLGRTNEAEALFERALRIETDSGRDEPNLHIRYEALLRAAGRTQAADDIAQRISRIRTAADAAS